MPTNNVLAYDGFWRKSALFIRRSIERRNNGDHEDFHFQALLALEFLAKAALARRHPSLIADPTDLTSLRVACGILNEAQYKTVNAATLYERCRVIVDGFTRNHEKFCNVCASRRNGHLHSAEFPLAGIELGQWQNEFWKVVNALVKDLDMKLEDYVGEEESVSVRKILADASAAHSIAIKARIEHHRKKFLEEHPESTRREALKISWQAAEARTSENDTTADCPACTGGAVLRGWVDVYGPIEFDEEGWSYVQRVEVVAEEFVCQACGLWLVGAEDMEIAGIDPRYVVEVEPDADYECGYMNE